MHLYFAEKCNYFIEYSILILVEIADEFKIVIILGTGMGSLATVDYYFYWLGKLLWQRKIFSYR